MDSVLKAQSEPPHDPRPTSSCSILNPPMAEHPALSNMPRHLALNPDTAGNVQNEKPGTQCGNSPARKKQKRQKPPHLINTHTHPKLQVGERQHRTPGAAWGAPWGAGSAARPRTTWAGSRRSPLPASVARAFPGAELPRGSGGAGTHTSKRGRRRGSDISRQRGPLPAAAARGEPRPPAAPRSAGGGRGGGGGCPTERLSSRRADAPRRCPPAPSALRWCRSRGGQPRPPCGEGKGREEEEEEGGPDVGTPARPCTPPAARAAAAAAAAARETWQ